jgi:hypothetical protein
MCMVDNGGGASRKGFQTAAKLTPEDVSRGVVGCLEMADQNQLYTKHEGIRTELTLCICNPTASHWRDAP